MAFKVGNCDEIKLWIFFWLRKCKTIKKKIYEKSASHV